MKRFFFVLMSVVTLCLCTTSCSKDEPGFDQSVIIGTWDISEVYIDGNWIDITSSYYSKFHASITFKNGGQYYGTGYFGTGSGTYTFDGKVIKTYVDDQLLYKYDVVSLTTTSCELIMSDDSSKSSLQIRAKKR